MSLINRHIYLSENQTPKQPVHQFKHCSKCNESRAPEGGIDLGPGKWYCANCWALKAIKNKRRGG